MCHFVDIVHGRRGEASSSGEPPSSREPSSSCQRPTTSRSRRRVEDATQPPISEAVEANYASPSSIVEEHPNDQPFLSEQKQDDIYEPLSSGPRDRSILKSFKHHIACAIWAGEVSFINFF